MEADAFLAAALPLSMTNGVAPCIASPSASAGGYPRPLTVLAWITTGRFIASVVRSARRIASTSWPSIGPM